MHIKEAWRVLMDGLPALATKEVEIIKHIEVPYEIVRHQLGSINLKDMQEPDKMEIGERKQYVSEIALITMKKPFRNEIDLLRHAQAFFMAELAQDMRQLDFGRGTMNGITLVLERFEALATEHLKNTEPAGDIDKNAPIEETTISDLAGLKS